MLFAFVCGFNYIKIEIKGSIKFTNRFLSSRFVMAQNEDTELRDLVIDALEKNGSLAKIRALLRANIFLAFEDECHLKQNEALNKILNIPEGKLCLSIIHEFLDFCNLRNTLFVYKSETRQGKEYEYQSENLIAEKLCISKNDGVKEPILLSLIKNSLNLSSQNIYKQNDIHNNSQSKDKRNFGSDENCTYFVNEDSSTTSQSQSDNSSDEKNKLDLRLHLDNSDTDTSSSSKCKSSSEYIPNKNLKIEDTDGKINKHEKNINSNQVSTQNNSSYTSNKSSKSYLHDLKLVNNSSDSTSYAELKPFNSLDKILLNTTGLPLSSDKDVKQVSPHNNSNSTSSKIETLSLIQTIDSKSETLKNNSQHSQKSVTSLKNAIQPDGIENETTDYSYDFTSPLSDRKEISERNRNTQDTNINKSDMSLNSPKQNSVSSQSSVSISDVADLISEASSKKYSLDKNISDKSKLSGSQRFNKSPRDNKILSDDSGDFSESPIPSLSNLSLDIHSE